MHRRADERTQATTCDMESGEREVAARNLCSIAAIAPIADGREN